ncbi:hypothetical protein SDC9_146825 [bioreactor metagenome]|uniref:Uncharacterized protein n=1 Tax=bioreactor metagenome TaxID=1076179 RepID=A0A645EFV0_9ZZZZ
METQSAGKQAVSVGNMDNIRLIRSHRRQLAGNELIPDAQVLPGIPRHNLLACGA